MEKLNYEIVGVEVQPFTYRHPLIVVNEDGEVQISYSQKRDDAIHIKRITFLSMVGRDANGHIKLYKPIEHVNRFLMAHHIDDGREESSQYSKALIHFFSFLTALQEKWDAENDGDLFHANATLKIDRTKHDIKYGSGSFFDDLGNRMIYDEFTLKIHL